LSTPLPDSALPWRCTGDPYIGKICYRTYSDGLPGVFGKITAHLEAINEKAALWHLVHDDGDEEDLELHEVRAALDSMVVLVGRKVRRSRNGPPGTVVAHENGGDQYKVLFGGETPMTMSTRTLLNRLIPEDGAPDGTGGDYNVAEEDWVLGMEEEDHLEEMGHASLSALPVTHDPDGLQPLEEPLSIEEPLLAIEHSEEGDDLLLPQPHDERPKMEASPDTKKPKKRRKKELSPEKETEKNQRLITDIYPFLPPPTILLTIIVHAVASVSWVPPLVRVVPVKRRKRRRRRSSQRCPSIHMLLPPPSGTPPPTLTIHPNDIGPVSIRK